MKFTKKLIALLIAVTMLLTVAVPCAFAAPTSADAKTLPEVPEGYDGYVTLSVEAFVLGWGFIIEPTLVPFNEGETLAVVTDRLFNTNEVEYTYGGTIESGYYITGVASSLLANGTEITVPEYLEDELINNFGCIDEDTNDWYFPENGDGILSQMEYTYYSGWMMTDNNEAPSVGADGLTVEEGHVYRWMYSIYGYGMDVGISDGFGMFAPFENPSMGVDRDAAYSLLAEISVDAELVNTLMSDMNVLGAYLDLYGAVTDLSSTQADIDAALSALQALLFGPTVVPGDLDGDGIVTVKEALSILRHTLGLSILDDSKLAAADVDGNGTITTTDALFALRIALSLA